MYEQSELQMRERGKIFPFSKQTVNVISPFTSHFSRKRCAFTLAEVFHPAEQSKRTAFTLAEVLITLGIIGVVAALTMPSLIANYQKQQTVTKLKKAYSEITQAIMLAEAESPRSYSWSGFQGWGEGNKKFFEEYFVKNMKFVKVCSPTTNECWSDKPVILQNGTNNINQAAYRSIFQSGVTASGYSIYCWLGNNEDNTQHTQIFIDINGPKKGKHIYGKDIFNFSYTLGSRNLNMSSNTRDDALEDCIQNRDCLRLIIKDNWQIAPDYPW